MFLGIDTSTYFDEQAVGAKYFLDGQQIDPLKAFIDQGVKYMRIRVWNDPKDENGKPYLGGNCDLANFIKLANLAKTYGYHFILDFHYSDFWTDPGKQTCPKAWKGLSLKEVEEKLYQFTKDSLLEVKKHDIPVDYVQVGNEITNGMVWPVAKLDASTDPRGNYEALATLLKAGVKAVKEVDKNIKTIIHLEKSNDQHIYYEYFTNIIRLGVDFDVIGMSYYPYWHGGFNEFFANVDMCKKAFDKPVMIAEVGYGFTLEDYILTNNGDAHMAINPVNVKDLMDHLPHPITIEGQGLFIKDLIRLAKEHDVYGICYWEPLWLPHGEDICWASKEGQAYINELGKSTRNEWSNQCMFDYNGNALPSFKEYKI